MSEMIFSHPEPARSKTRILPIFMPFAGCRTRCVYCSQTIQTGTAEAQLKNIYNFLQQILENAEDDAAFEVAFYGGTFTALPFEWQKRLVSLAAHFKESGKVSGVRCSTRPDAVDREQLLLLKDLGLRTVELGVQSYNNTVLANSKRGYTEDVIVSACNTVIKCSLDLGVQLLPGLPGMDSKIFQDDIRKTCSIAPAVVRLYPCLVFEDTVLARWFARGEYAPWALDETVGALGVGLLDLWRHGIRVIRIGVAQEDGLTDSLVAGPFHPAMGNMVRSEALRCLIVEKMQMLNKPFSRLFFPKRYQGELWGYKGAHKAFWKSQGLTPENALGWNLPVFQMD
ncbi:radical SAM protein [Halodesulfovibrio aestuarii]|uniref:Radical SAM superfamily protein n=2 Tax=Halodesulfovibrio aestuarii TaxID=126333 RepID=A0A8G2CAI7_9BACT|nr:radical SAM protein [Halodesulfovibrio aestuarii]SHJ34831.1 Radical SAM superfamily protein [Halodesulfovibrio aestuarii]